VNAEYKYLRSSWSNAFCFSALAALLDPIRKLDQRDDMPDMTLRTLDTEWIELPSEFFCL
jgi:hypothetical protein